MESHHGVLRGMSVKVQGSISVEGLGFFLNLWQKVLSPVIRSLDFRKYLRIKDIHIISLLKQSALANADSCLASTKYKYKLDFSPSICWFPPLSLMSMMMPNIAFLLSLLNFLLHLTNNPETPTSWPSASRDSILSNKRNNYNLVLSFVTLLLSGIPNGDALHALERISPTGSLLIPSQLHMRSWLHSPTGEQKRVARVLILQCKLPIEWKRNNWIAKQGC